MRIVLGSPVLAGDDKVGTVRAVAFNPDTMALTHIIVKRGLFKSDASIPVRALLDARTATDSGGQVNVHADNGAIVGLRDFDRNANTEDAALPNPQLGLAVPPTPAGVSGIGTPAALTIPGTVGSTSPYQGTGTGAGVVERESQFVGGADTGRDTSDYADAGRSGGTPVSSDNGPTPGSNFAGDDTSDADRNADADIDDPTLTDGSDDVPFGVQYVYENADVRDIGHDKVGTLEAITFTDLANPVLDTLIVKGSGKVADMAIPRAWVGGFNDKSVTLLRAVEDIEQMSPDQFANASAAPQARDSALAYGEAKSDADSRASTGERLTERDVPGNDDSVPQSQEDSTDPTHNPATDQGDESVAGGLGRRMTGGEYQEDVNRASTLTTNAGASALDTADRAVESTGSTFGQGATPTTDTVNDVEQGRVIRIGAHDLEDGNQTASDVSTQMDAQRSQNAQRQMFGQ